mgnify:CR=1 FL=1
MAKKENVKLNKLEFGEERVVLDMIHADEGLKSTFSGSRNTLTRIANADYTALIKVGNKTVGFIMLVYNGRTDKHEIDMGILSEHRGKGYGTIALGKLKQLIIANGLNVDIQTRQVNEAAIKSIVKNGFVLYKQDQECYYFKLPVEGKKQGR